ncbi:MAG TPA: hypothetical protein EYG80_00535 [Flavobacteriaceae bacterium]|nr:hypothetical protein [Flavobacteriaceae bacterium]
MKNIINLTNELNKYVDEKCRVTSKNDAIYSLINSIKKELKDLENRFSNIEYIEALFCDIDIWLKEGIDNIPSFTTSRDSLGIVLNNESIFFFGPIRIANGYRTGDNYRFEAFLARRSEPNDLGFKYMYSKYPHPKNICQSSILMAGTRGILSGNNLVFFPENILSNSPVVKQDYAIFFFNKFYDIYTKQTLPLINKIGLNQNLKSEELSNDENYKARCVWGYLHDYYHHIGLKPFDENIKIKTNFFVGILEEVKVDMQTLTTCLLDKGIPFSNEVSEFILLDRVFRYPTEGTWKKNFDSHTGLFLQTYFFQNEILLKNKDGSFTINRINLIEKIYKLIYMIEQLEREFDDDIYLSNAKNFVLSYIKIGGYPDFLDGTKYAKCIGAY